MSWFSISIFSIILYYALGSEAVHSSSYNVREIIGKRSLLELEMKGSPLYGNVTKMFYYYVDVLVGDPKNPSKQSVIVDTGSTITWFPCKGFCNHCGKHIYPEFDIHHSQSK